MTRDRMQNSKTNKILIVDDADFTLMLLEAALVDIESAELFKALNGADALEIIANEDIDLILLDLNMPGIHGFEVLRQLKADEINRYIPVIVITSDDEERLNALEEGAEEFLAKPIDVLELRFRAQNLLKLKKYNDLQRNFNSLLEAEIERKESQLVKLAHVEQELTLARDIQESLIPKSFKDYEDIELYGRCIQAMDVGGDLFDIFESEYGNYTNFIIADVSGHGFGSALVSAQFRSLVRAELMFSHKKLHKSVSRINTVFSNDNADTSMFITALIMRYDHDTCLLESVNAGHHEPLSNLEFKHHSGIPLGIKADVVYEELQTTLKSGDRVILYTDGLLESQNSTGEMYNQRLIEHFEETPQMGIKNNIDTLLSQFYDFIYKQDDDVTILGIKKK